MSRPGGLGSLLLNHHGVQDPLGDLRARRPPRQRLLGPDDLGGLPEQGGAPGGDDLVVEVSHRRVAGDPGRRVGVAALHPDREMRIADRFPPQPGGFPDHLAGKLDAPHDGAVGAAVLRRVQQLHPLPARGDLVRQSLGAELGISHAGAGGMHDHRGDVGIPAETDQEAGDLLAVVGRPAGAVVHRENRPGAGDEVADGLGDDPLRDDQHVVASPHRAVGSDVAKETHGSLLLARSPRARVPSRLWMWTSAPLAIATLARPMISPYFRMISP